MTLLTVLEAILVLVVLGTIVWFVNTKTRLPGWTKTLIDIIAIVVAFFFVMHFFGLWDYLGSVSITGHGHRHK
jgi:type III secretory pathway component EscS